ncbi:MAG: Ni,Fe-hydrogenase III large subunit [Gammaproteobacteria bacterium]|jgi:Ni,Fe-hydrogenase III large subunit
MTVHAEFSNYRSALDAGNVRMLREDDDSLAPIRSIEIAPGDWYTLAQINAAQGHRFAGLWGDPVNDELNVRACFEHEGQHIVYSTTLPLAQPHLPSISSIYPGADRLERHMHDLLGVMLTNSVDNRRWTRHQAWPDDEFPLRNDFPVAAQTRRRTPSDMNYPFETVRGSGVYEIPVGPVHAGIIEPGHFRFQAVGEDILRLEERLGYVHKGVEKIAVGRDVHALARLAGRVSGDSTVAHAWAACQAMERAVNCRVPARGLYLRAVLCERERIANHLGDLGAICNDVGFVFAHMQCARLREQWQRRSNEIFGHRLLMDTIIPGGVGMDLTTKQAAQLHQDNDDLRHAIVPLFDIINDHPSLDDRLIDTGVLSTDDARSLGCTGFVGKASGEMFDTRADAPYSPYDAFEIEVPTFTRGDVASRVRVRMHEVRSTVDLLDQLLARMPEGDIGVRTQTPAPGATGLGIIESWRGEVITFVRFGNHGRIARFFPRDPSWFTWPALERLIHGNIVPDFPVCNKSVNASYSGQDL